MSNAPIGGTPVVLVADHFAPSPNGKIECGAKTGSLTYEVDKARCGRCTVGTHRTCRGCKRGALAVSMADANWLEVDLCSSCGGEKPKGKKKTAKAKA